MFRWIGCFEKPLSYALCWVGIDLTSSLPLSYNQRIDPSVRKSSSWDQYNRSNISTSWADVHTYRSWHHFLSLATLTLFTTSSCFFFPPFTTSMDGKDRRRSDPINFACICGDSTWWSCCFLGRSSSWWWQPCRTGPAGRDVLNGRAPTDGHLIYIYIYII